MRFATLTFIAIFLLPNWAFGQDQEYLYPLPVVTLAQPPVVNRLEHVSVTAARNSEINALIDDLAQSKLVDAELNSHIEDYLPVGRFNSFGIFVGEEVESSDAMRKLIEIGPDAIPLLLERLDDGTPTNVIIVPDEHGVDRTGTMAFGEAWYGNPVNPTERRILSLNGLPRSTLNQSVPPELDSYQIRIGDLCFVAIGQITGRQYELIRRPARKFSGILICSPVEQKSMRDQLYKIWNSDHPRQKLLDSLLIDFSTRGVLHDDKFNRWYIGNAFQLAAVKRLLYYFPEIAAPIISDRITNLQATAVFKDDCKVNGLRADNFVDAVSWSENSQVSDALATLNRRAKQKVLIQSLRRWSNRISK